jgi:hypothetical protein
MQGLPDETAYSVLVCCLKLSVLFIIEFILTPTKNER